MNGSASQRLFIRFAQLDKNLAILLVLQLLLLHCYVCILIDSFKWILKIVNMLFGFYVVDSCQD